MLNVRIRPQPAVAGVPVIAATAGEISSDEILVERIAAGNKLAMQALFARHLRIRGARNAPRALQAPVSLLAPPTSRIIT